MKFENFPKQEPPRNVSEQQEKLTPEQEQEVKEAVEQAVQFQEEEIRELFENPQENEGPGNPEEPKRLEKPSSSRMKKALCILTASAMFFAFSPKEAGAEQQKKSIPEKQTEQLGKDMKNIGKRTADTTKRTFERNVQKVISDSIEKGWDTIFGKRR